MSNSAPDFPEGCYHVVLRGNHSESLFLASRDRDELNRIIGEALKQFTARLHAYCWTAHQLHALIEIGAGPLDKLIGRIAMRYSRYRKKGAYASELLFDTRYYIRVVEADDEFLGLLRDIHLIPVTANFLTDPEDYPWSSHRTYLGIDANPIVTTKFGLRMFSAQIDCARATYHHFIVQGITQDLCGTTGNEPDVPTDRAFRSKSRQRFLVPYNSA